MITITQYKTFDGELHSSEHAAQRHLRILETKLINELATELNRCNVVKISNPQDRDFLIRAQNNESEQIFRRHFYQYFIDEYLDMFLRLNEIKQDRHIQESEGED